MPVVFSNANIDRILGCWPRQAIHLHHRGWRRSIRTSGLLAMVSACISRKKGSIMKRRTILSLSAFGGAGLLLWRYERRASLTAGTTSAEPKTRRGRRYSDAGVRQGVRDVLKIGKSESEWRRQLKPLSFEVTRHADTERPFTGFDVEPPRRGPVPLRVL